MKDYGGDGFEISEIIPMMINLWIILILELFGQVTYSTPASMQKYIFRGMKNEQNFIMVRVLLFGSGDRV